MTPSARILVVDDDQRIAASVRRSLAYEGHDVAVAHDGPGALTSATAFDPDLIVLDLMLPGIDGIEVCRRLRAGGFPGGICVTPGLDEPFGDLDDSVLADHLDAYAVSD